MVVTNDKLVLVKGLFLIMGIDLILLINLVWPSLLGNSKQPLIVEKHPLRRTDRQQSDGLQPKPFWRWAALCYAIFISKQKILAALESKYVLVSPNVGFETFSSVTNLRSHANFCSQNNRPLLEILHVVPPGASRSEQLSGKALWRVPRPN